jgi:phosphoribosylanthranilate isomerase
MKLKVCGMKYEKNIRQVLALEPDYMGFIFYKDSVRYVDQGFSPLSYQQQKVKTKFVGVFVNATINEVKNKVSTYKLDYVQLHGNESTEYCLELSSQLKIIKVFRVDDDFDFKRIEPYKLCCKYFMFDTFTNEYGGSGKSFNWNKLVEYDNEIPFFLSGGISLENIDDLLSLKQLNIHAIDVNSRFEISPGLKDVEKLKMLKEKIKKYETEQKI